MTDQIETPAAPLSDMLAQAIERHKAAWDIWWAADGDDALNAANGPANRALWNLAETPCASDAEFVAKLRHLLACHDRLNEDDADTTECPEILAAIRQHTEARS